MIPYIILTLSVFCIASQSVFGGFYNRKNEGARAASSLYNLLQIGSAFLLWTVLWLIDFGFDPCVIPYGLLFGVFYTVCLVGMIYAIATGPVALTSLFLQLSLIGTTLWGFLFWDAPVTPTAVIGLLLVAVALFLCLYEGRGGEKRITKRWFLFAMMTFLGNAGCSIVQRTQQTDFSGEYSELFMFVAMALSTATVLFLFLRGDRSETKTILRRSWFHPLGAGVCNVLLNLFVMLLAVSSLSPTLIYPVIAVGGLIVTMIFSIVAFRERFRPWQWLGVALGTLAVGILSI